MKFCKDCKYFIPAPESIAHCATCAKAPSSTPDSDYMVLGRGVQVKYGYCGTQRIGPTTATNCGVDAGWFVPITIKQEAAPDFIISPKGERIIQGGHA